MSEFDARALRDAFGRFTTGITVITAAAEDGPFGMTVNSFASLSMEPPLLLWNLQRDSDCFAAFAGIEHFAVNVLHAGQQSIAEACARKADHALAQELWQPGEAGCPVLRQSLACFECAAHERYEGGDHVILTGKVLCFRCSTGEPLLFYGGGYRVLAQEPAP